MATNTPAPQTRSKSKKTLGGIDYFEAPEFPSGKLPTKRDIIQNMLYLLRPRRAGQDQRSKSAAAQLLAEILQEHWLFCNLYTLSTTSIKKHILDLYECFIKLVQTREPRRNDAYVAKVEQFKTEASLTFDIFCEDESQRHKLENAWGIKMTTMEWNFLHDQRSDRKMVCEDFVDRKWVKTMERRSHDLKSLEKSRIASEEHRKSLEGVSGVDHENNSASEESGDDTDSNFKPENIPEIEEGPSHRTRYSNVSQDEGDSLPAQYRHIRTGVRKVRPEYYETLDKLKSSYHMSQFQAEGAVVEVGNNMFGRKWKFHKKSSGEIDLDMLPDSKCSRLVGKKIEAQALSEIVKEIMNASDNCTITYADDGSKKQGAGSFSVQGIIINGVWRALPTLSIASESRENLALLKETTLDLLEAVSNVPKRTLFERLDFVMTDSTSHNKGVHDLVAENIGAVSMPDHLFCNVHPSLMFNRVIVQLWAKIEAEIGRDKIFANFLVEATTHSNSVTEQALGCFTKLINHDFDHKPWNKANEFDVHIAPRKNLSVSLKDERFNRLTLTCAVALYHYDDVESFLEKYQHVTNQLACIVRSFMELDFLKIMFCVGALIGLHLVEPFLSLTTSSATTYTSLIPAFKRLYDDLTTSPADHVMDTTNQAFSFVSAARFKSCKYQDVIIQAISNTVQQFPDEIRKVLKLLLPLLAQGFKNQKGKIFGFGQDEESDDDNSQYELAKMDQAKLAHAPIHNLAAERSVGFVNYELKQRGAKQLPTVSSVQVKAKARDLLDAVPSGSYKQYSAVTKPGGKVSEILLKWKTEQEALRQLGLRDKEIANIAVDKRKNGDLAKLKAQGGPFTNVKELEQYIAKKGISAKEKNARLYIEVRYARDTSLTLPKNSDIFRLKKEYKNLPTEQYVKNLKVYLSNTVSVASATVMDLNAAVDNLFPSE